MGVVFVVLDEVMKARMEGNSLREFFITLRKSRNKEAILFANES